MTLIGFIFLIFIGKAIVTCSANIDYRGTLWNKTIANTTLVYDCKSPFRGNTEALKYIIQNSFISAFDLLFI